MGIEPTLAEVKGARSDKCAKCQHILQKSHDFYHREVGPIYIALSALAHQPTLTFFRAFPT